MAPLPRSLVALTLLLPLVAAPAMAGPVEALIACHGEVACSQDATFEASESFQQTAAGWASAVLNPIAAAALPDGGHGLLLIGESVATATVNGRTATCQGPSTAVLEASHKTFSLEPSITFTYGGALQEGGFLLPCLMGQKVQPVQTDLQPGSNFPDGPWSTVKKANGFVWTLSVGAPEGGARWVEYTYTSPDGMSRATFSGSLLMYR